MAIPRLIDCFIFSNELDLLEARLEILGPLVDHFVLVEGGTTFQGEPKPMHYEQMKNRFSHRLPKIMHIQIPAPAQAHGHWDTWEMEFQSRDAIRLGLKYLNLSLTDTVFLSDVDEIPDLDKWCRLGSPVPALFQQWQSYYYMDYRAEGDYMWHGTCVVSYADFLHHWIRAENLRGHRGSISCRIPKAGWHWSCLGGPEAISKKLQAFAHAEYNKPEFTDPEVIRRRITEKDDVLGRPEMPDFERVPIDSTFPIYVRDHIPLLLERGLISPLSDPRTFAPWRG